MTDNFNPRASAIRETLRAKLPDVEAATRGRIVRTLIASGHAVDDLSSDALYAADSGRSGAMPILTPLQAAADARNVVLLREAQGHCRALGFHWDISDKRIDVLEMEKCFAAAAAKRPHDGAISERCNAKQALYELRLIPR